MNENKVRYGLRNVHVAVLESDDPATLAYGASRRLPGAVELTLEPRGDALEFEADDGMYHTSHNNQGYDGTLNIALLPDWFLTEILGEVKLASGEIRELADSQTKNFAIAFEYQGDKNATRHWLYNCSASRVPLTSTTGKSEVNTTELSFVASPIELADGSRPVKGKFPKTSDSYDTVFDAVPLTVVASPEVPPVEV